MAKTIVLILTFVTFIVKLFSQDLTMKCGDSEIGCNNGNLDHFEMVEHCPYEETDTTKLPSVVRDNARRYLTTRVGQQFYLKLNYYQCQIVDFQRFDEIKQEKGWIDENLSDKRVKYAIQYYFVIQDSLRYYLSLVFDKDGRIISKDQLPSVRKNKRFNEIISVCDANKIAEHGKAFNAEYESTSLEYMDRRNCFVWRIEVEEAPVPRGKPNKIIHRILLLNANNGKVMKREKETWISVGHNDHF
ncbi:MAG TPA: hypothetical protein VE978_13930 [Chitinophagales bacterium]|nr:hypothetical protein [Chitinophagales bacterium]